MNNDMLDFTGDAPVALRAIPAGMAVLKLVNATTRRASTWSKEANNMVATLTFVVVGGEADGIRFSTYANVSHVNPATQASGRRFAKAVCQASLGGRETDVTAAAAIKDGVPFVARIFLDAESGNAEIALRSIRTSDGSWSVANNGEKDAVVAQPAAAAAKLTKAQQARATKAAKAAASAGASLS